MKKFDAEAALRLIQDERITHSQWVPTMFVRLLALAPEVRGESISAATDLRFTPQRRALNRQARHDRMVGDIIHEYYSGTESNGSTAISPSEWLEHPGSVGKAFHGEIKILDEQFNELPAGRPAKSTLLAATPLVSQRSGENGQRVLPQGWSSRDIGYVDDEGYLYLKDRKSFMIISGCQYLPQEIEDVLINHPAVLDVAVFGIPIRSLVRQ